MANSVDPDQTAPIGAVGSGSTLFASMLLSVMLGNYLQQTTSAGDIFGCIFLGALRVKKASFRRGGNTSGTCRQNPQNLKAAVLVLLSLFMRTYVICNKSHHAANTS